MHDKWTGPELDSLLGKASLSRRDVIMTSLAVGFAAAAGPVSADTVIATNADGITAGEVKIPTADGEIPAYRAMPAKGGPFPVVLVVQEIFGVHEHIKDVCRRLAKLGYLAIAPELYARQGDVDEDHATVSEMFAEIVAKVPDAQVMSRPRCDGRLGRQDAARATRKRLAVTGFCWGGRITWLYAAHNPHFKAGVAWYGRLVGDIDAVAAEASDRRRRRRSRRRCSGCTAARTRAFRSTTSRRCARRCAAAKQPVARSSCIPMRRTASTPTTGRAIAPRMRARRGRSALRGSASTGPARTSRAPRRSGPAAASRDTAARVRCRRR